MADTPAITDSKPWYKSRTIWAAVVTVLLGAIGPLSTAFGHPIVIPDWIIQVLIGMGIYTARTSNTPIA